MNNYYTKSIYFVFLFIGLGCATMPEDLIEPQREDAFTYFSTNDGLIDYEVYSIFEDSDGNIWVGTYLGVSKFNGSSFQNFTPQNSGLIPGAIWAIGEDFNGTIWVGSSVGYSTYDGSDWFTGTGLPLTSFYLDTADNFWIGADGFGVLLVDESGIEFYDMPGCNECTFVTSIFEDSNNVWFTTLGGAIKVVDISTQSIQRFTESNGLVSNYLSSGVMDQWGNLFFAAFDSDAVSRYTESDFSSVNLPVGYAPVSGMANDGKNIYITTEGLGFLFYDGVVMREIITPKIDFYFNCVLADKKGNVWIGTTDNGLIRYTPKFNF